MLHKPLITALSLFMFTSMASGTEPNYYYCHTSSETADQLFITDVFQADPGMGRQIQVKFHQLIVADYNADDLLYENTTCYYSLDEEESIDNRDDYLEDHLNGRTRIDVDFNY